MHLKNLTVLGFKSFADKTSLNFQPGITAIVGPNGCGKSNVADAIRWVLGEQSAKALRGGEMADVIFNGTDGRRSVGMAEVSLTVGNVDGAHLKAAGVEVDFNEVTLTRRVFRDGASEYFINKVPCRLKDLQQLFMGTGVGRTSYSIMAQGNITQLLSSRPEDRRMVFEEAAGITKFKAQKREALRKLDYTEQNLLRISDLIREVKRQIGSLQRQAGKARRYKQLSLELQHLDTQLSRHQYDVLHGEIRERQTAVEGLRTEIEVFSENVLRAENEIAQLRERLAELEQEISRSQHQGLELKNQIERHDHAIHFNQERLHELESQNGKALTDIAQAEERCGATQEEITIVTQQLSASVMARDRYRQALQSRKEAIEGLEASLRTQQESLRKSQADAFAAAQQLSRVRNEINALDLQKQGNVVRLEKLSAEKIQLEEERTRLEARLLEFTSQVEAEKLNVALQQGTVEERQERLRQIQQQLSTVGQELEHRFQQIAEKKSRLNVLEQLEAEHEGFSAGTLAALNLSQREQHVLGSLADKIRVSDQYVDAIEAALGHHLQLVLTAHPEAAQQILSHLSANHRGRASIAPLGLLEGLPETASGATTPDDPGPIFAVSHVGDAPESERLPALRVIDADTSVQPLLQRLLGQTWIVPDLARATSIWRESRGQCDLVTLKGELLSRYGVYTGGSANGAGKTAASVLGRKNQITDLRARLARLADEVNEASRQKGALQSDQTALQATLQQAQSELHSQEVAIATRQGEFNILQNSQRVLHQKIDTVVYEIQSLAAHEKEGTNKRDNLAAQIGILEQGECELQRQLTELNKSVDGLRQQREGANLVLTEAKVALATEDQLCASFRQQQQPLEQRITELRQLIEQRRSEIASVLTRKGQAEVEIEQSRQKIATLSHERESVSTQTAELLSTRDAQAEEIAGREDQLREQRRRLTDAQQQRGLIEVELAQKNMVLQNLCERIQQKYQVNLQDVRSECITITIATDGPPKVQTLTPEEMSAIGASTDWAAVAEQVIALQKRLDEMGPVNLVAIEEYEETEQRHQFLTSQCDDLIHAKAELLDVINRINLQTREMFTDTFGKIRENFRALFSEIFGGGKADLLLVDEGDVLESGIDIVARPPGKQLQSITLLSGGEQTMTAVALLFAIYQVKPSPFCVLDELDAPLDESNINRFIRVLQRFLVHSQFVIITHNKRTIGMADILYGITMEEQGISKIVSVKFHKAEEAVTDRQPIPLVPPVSGPAVEEMEDKLQPPAETLEFAMT